MISGSEKPMSLSSREELFRWEGKRMKLFLGRHNLTSCFCGMGLLVALASRLVKILGRCNGWWMAAGNVGGRL